jgi:hypothetical protein
LPQSSPTIVVCGMITTIDIEAIPELKRAVLETGARIRYIKLSPNHLVIVETKQDDGGLRSTDDAINEQR